jgi:RNA polymerase II subunit A small phosphatase-like protein
MARKLLIFDLDETLVHATTEEMAAPADFEWPPYYVYKRPYLTELLSQTNPYYDFAVWSSASRDYVDILVERIFDAQFEVKFSWAVDRCVQRVHPQSNGYVYIKDLRKVQSQGYEVENILIVDDSPEKIARQPRNHLVIKPFLGQADDTELLTLAEDLIRRAKMW